jgi:hypothetical protein
MPRTQLASLIERLSVRQGAQAERRLYHRRGGERLPGARGGVFFEKITDAERVLITVLYQRQLCTRKVLAELFDVTPTTIGIACRRVGPLLEQDGYIPTPAPSPHNGHRPSRLRNTPKQPTGTSTTAVLILYGSRVR